MAETPKDTFVMAKNFDDIISLDPAEVFELSGGEVIANVYDRIMTHEAENTEKLVPGVAESYTVSDDGKTITLKIRPGLKFHSGNPLTAEDVAFSLQRVILLDKTPAFILSQFGWTKDNVKDLVKATDPSTVQLTITEDFSPTLVLNCLSAGVGSVVDKKLVLEHERDGDLGYEWLKTHSAGSGPFELKSWKPNETIVLEAFPGDRHGAPKVKRVVIRHVAEPAAQRLLLEKGDIDLARDLTTDQIQGIAGNKDIVIETHPKADLYYLALNQKDERLSNPKVRQAIRWLIDYQGMADTFLKGRFKVHQSFWPSGFEGSLTDTPFHLDVAKGKQLLAEAGYPDGFEVELDAANSSPQSDIAQSIQQTLGQAGIKAKIVSGDQKQVLTKYRSRQHQMLLLYWSPDYIDPHSNADSFARNPDNSDNASAAPLAWRNAWDIPEITKETDAAARERDPDKRLQMYIDLQKKLQEDSPFVILFQKVDQVARRANVTGFVSGASFDQVYYRLVSK
ncbi:MAG: ABC transporter substrate-binding protein [Rhodospirillaceae bacterium]|nr:ABC transporter substrate-binding protein [Rhodospirillaceae bacterium]